MTPPPHQDLAAHGVDRGRPRRWRRGNIGAQMRATCRHGVNQRGGVVSTASRLLDHGQQSRCGAVRLDHRGRPTRRRRAGTVPLSSVRGFSRSRSCMTFSHRRPSSPSLDLVEISLNGWDRSERGNRSTIVTPCALQRGDMLVPSRAVLPCSPHVVPVYAALGPQAPDSCHAPTLLRERVQEGVAGP